tara:strand:+ start:6738 stop:7124 length:387 start_codon:yes stop_codon:yes gene_type:complete
MPDKLKNKFKNIYIANIENINVFNSIKNNFQNEELSLNNMLFDLQYISKSSYTFDLIILFDVNDLITSELLTDIKTNILDPKGEIWVLCDDKKIGNIKKETYLLTILENTNLRSSKFLQNGACIYILK